MTSKLRAEITLSNDTPPEGFDPYANSWRVTLRYQGRTLTVPFYTGSMAGEPTAGSVLECLLADANLGDETFDDFCADLGYDTDSRRALASWEACRRMTPRLSRLLGADYDDATQDPELWIKRHTDENDR